MCVLFFPPPTICGWSCPTVSSSLLCPDFTFFTWHTHTHTQIPNIFSPSYTTVPRHCSHMSDPPFCSPLALSLPAPPSRFSFFISFSLSLPLFLSPSSDIEKPKLRKTTRESFFHFLVNSRSCLFLPFTPHFIFLPPSLFLYSLISFFLAPILLHPSSPPPSLSLLKEQPSSPSSSHMSMSPLFMLLFLMSSIFSTRSVSRVLRSSVRFFFFFFWRRGGRPGFQDLLLMNI